ncbi:MAG: type IX secretion system membrane protein PorP/SprF [Siphonobacter sp.]
MPKHYLPTLLLFLIFSSSIAQQRAQYSQYMFNSYIINPAWSGMEDYIDLKSGYRNQWVGVEGAPKTFYIAGNAALDKSDRTSSLSVRGPNGRPLARSKVFRSQQHFPDHNGIGAIFLRDETGPSSRTTFDITYAHHFVLTNFLKLSTGISAGVTQHTLDFDKLQLLEPNDPLSGYGKLSKIVPDINAGALLYSANFYVGASVNQLLFKKLNYGFNGTSDYEWLGRLYNHYFLTAGYRFDISNDFALLPSAMVKSVRPTPVSFDLNLKALFQDRVWLGASYRHKDAIVGLIGVNVNYLLNIGYSYDFTFSNLSTVSKGTHEIVISLMLANRQRILCPRLF